MLSSCTLACPARAWLSSSAFAGSDMTWDQPRAHTRPLPQLKIYPRKSSDVDLTSSTKRPVALIGRLRYNLTRLHTEYTRGGMDNNHDGTRRESERAAARSGEKGGADVGPSWHHSCSCPAPKVRRENSNRRHLQQDSVLSISP